MTNQAIKYHPLGAMLALVVLSACSSGESTEPSATPGETTPGETTPAETTPAETTPGESSTENGSEERLNPSTDEEVNLRVPGVPGSSDCMMEELPVTLAVSGAEVFAIGTVVEIRPADGPWWSTRHYGVTFESCDEPVNYGIDLVLTDLRGSAAEEELTLRIPASQLLMWGVTPTVTEGGAVEWADLDTMHGVEYGMQIGGFMTRPTGEDVYLLATNAIQYIPDEGLVWQESERLHHCLPSWVEAIEGREPEDVVDEFGEHLGTASNLRAYVDQEYEQSGFCADDPGDIPCSEDESGVYCPDDLRCDVETMVCVEG